MVQALVSRPADETNERVSVPFWACAGATIASVAKSRDASDVATRTNENVRPVFTGIERGVAMRTMAVALFVSGRMWMAFNRGLARHAIAATGIVFRQQCRCTASFEGIGGETSRSVRSRQRHVAGTIAGYSNGCTADEIDAVGRACVVDLGQRDVRKASDRHRRIIVVKERFDQIHRRDVGSPLAANDESS